MYDGTGICIGKYYYVVLMLRSIGLLRLAHMSTTHECKVGNLYQPCVGVLPLVCILFYIYRVFIKCYPEA